MRILFAILMAGHGIAHLPGFLVSWRLRSFPELPYRTSLFGNALEVGDDGMKVVGALWLAAAVAFVVLATGVLARTTWWHPLAYAVIIFSVALCLAGWPEARLGLVANVVILVLIALGVRGRWW